MVTFMHGPCHLDRLLNVKVDVEYQIIFVVVFFYYFCWEMHYGAPARSKKGLVISL